jgi:hypothetical protein
MYECRNENLEWAADGENGPLGSSSEAGAAVKYAGRNVRM